MRNAETMLGIIQAGMARDRSLASRLRSKDSRAVLRGAVGKAFPSGKQLAGRLPYRTSGSVGALAGNRQGHPALTQEEVVLRRSGEIHRPQFRPVNCVIQLMTLGWLLAACEGLRS